MPRRFRRVQLERGVEPVFTPVDAQSWLCVTVAAPHLFQKIAVPGICVA
ncbi:hypothetical protein GL4_1335 [Methyloceanibacter caenitepidi]|uniref:Uncharacterized protein n=1 Tax=Methyloceanibacter caenitepidi TaxID=1384459 RepID=A0A0A8K1F4_9HYPH|nr:hypothetical protein GL4_1335 [Methyloceanibacter caenitepidi]